MSGVFNLRPPQPKYTFIWDVQTALTYIKVNWPVNNVLLDKYLSLKLSMLLALASASRENQIQHLDISQMGRLLDQYKFVYTKLHKSWRKGKSPTSVSFFAYDKGMERWKEPIVIDLYSTSQGSVYLYYLSLVEGDSSIVKGYRNFRLWRSFY